MLPSLLVSFELSYPILQAPIHRSAWKGNSANFVLTEFWEVQFRNSERFSVRRVISSSCSHASPTKE